MEDQQKKVISFYLEPGSMSKLDAIAEAQRRNRSTQIAFLIDQEYAKLFSQPQPLITISEAEEAAGRA